MPYSCKTLITTGNELASREKRLSICLGANGFSFTETTATGSLLTFGEVEGDHAATMTDVLTDLKMLLPSLGIRPFGYAATELIVISDASVWVPDELFTATATRKYLKLVGSEPPMVVTCQYKPLESTAVFAADEQVVTAFKVALPGISVINQHVKMAQYKAPANHPCILTHWRKGRVDVAAFADARYIYGNTLRFSDDNEAVYHIVDVMKSFSLEASGTELLLCGDVGRELYAQARPYFPKVSLFNGTVTQLDSTLFGHLHTYRYALILM